MIGLTLWPAKVIERRFSAAILLLGAFHAYLTRHSVNGDGVSYIDIADNWLRLGKTAANGYFSPLYSWSLMLPLSLHPSTEWEGPLVHALNLLLLAFALAGFRFFFRELSKACPPVSQPAFTLIGYSMFAWAALRMITIAMVTPDMLYASLIFVLCGLLFLIFGGSSGWTYALMLGALWGLGFLARAAAMPIIAVSAIAAFFAFGRGARAIAKLALAGAAAAVIVAPWVVTLSELKGHWTLGSAGPLNYAWQVNGQPWEHARDPGMPHPTRRLAEHPSVYEFATPIVGTYPPWTDPSYWDEGLRMTIDLKVHSVFLAKSLLKLGALALELGGFLAALLMLWFARDSVSFSKGHTGWLILLSLIGISIYASLNVESRYFGAFWVVLWLSLWGSIHLPSTEYVQLLIPRLSTSVALVIGLALAHFTLVQVSLAKYNERDLRTAQGLKGEGVESGASVATIAIDNDIYWARLARLRITAEIPSSASAEFWASGKETRQEIFNKLQSVGVRYLLSAQSPPQSGANWRVVGPRPLYLLDLAQARETQ